MGFETLGEGLPVNQVGGLQFYPRPRDANGGFVPAFAGAQGAGSCTLGGNGGETSPVTYEVTTLTDNVGSPPAGSLREALEASEPRIVDIKVNGNIELLGKLSITDPFITINGDASGGKGVCVLKEKIEINTHDIIIRYMRFRVGDVLNGSPSQPEIDDMDSLNITYLSGDASSRPYNIMIDHCSISYGIDSNVDMWNENNLDVAGFGYLENITFQWCLLSDALRNSLHSSGQHSKGLLCGQGTRNISIHHCAFVDNLDRNPWCKGAEGFDWTNNVIFNIPGGGKMLWGGANANFDDTPTIVNGINNKELDGPNNASAGMFICILNNTGAPTCSPPGGQANWPALHQLYESGNKDKDDDEGWFNVTTCDFPGASIGQLIDRYEADTAFTTPGCVAITYEDTDDIIDVLVNGTGYDNNNGVGASHDRDAYDADICGEMLVARDSGPGAVDTAIIRPVDSPSQKSALYPPDGYPDLT
jgi:hypothetical protein